MARKPKYRKHSTQDCGFVEYNKRRTYFPGRHNSPESLAAFKQFMASLYESPKVIPPSQQPTLQELATAYLRYVEATFESHGTAGTFFEVKRSLRYLLSKSDGLGISNLLAGELGPLRLKEYQDSLVDRGLARRTVNEHIGRVRRWIKWCVSEQLVDVSVLAALQTVQGLKRGRTKAPDMPKRQPASWDDIEPCLPFLQSITRDMLWLQWYTGARSTSLCLAQPSQFTQVGDVWEWRPRHKTEYLGHDSVLFVGPQCQKVLTPYMERSDDEFLFNPRDGRNGGNRRYGKHYTRHSYRTALRRAQDSAIAAAIECGVQPPSRWTPHQLRHARGTLVREKWGLEAAQAVLSHATIQATQIYAQRQSSLARQVAAEDG